MPHLLSVREADQTLESGSGVGRPNSGRAGVLGVRKAAGQPARLETCHQPGYPPLGQQYILAEVCDPQPVAYSLTTALLGYTTASSRSAAHARRGPPLARNDAPAVGR
jgi:hypothetical protein